MPIILVFGLGFEVGPAQCLVAPPYVFAALVMIAAAWVGDKYHIRGPLLIFNATMAIVGLAIMGYVETVGVRYFGIFLVCAGANGNIPQVMSYQGNNIRGQWKRAFCSATLVGMGGVGGIAGSLVFRTQDAPTYIPGLWACIAASLLLITLVCILDVYFYFENKKQAAGSYAIEGSDVSHAAVWNAQQRANELDRMDSATLTEHQYALNRRSGDVYTTNYGFHLIVCSTTFSSCIRFACSATRRNNFSNPC